MKIILISFSLSIWTLQFSFSQSKKLCITSIVDEYADFFSATAKENISIGDTISGEIIYDMDSEMFEAKNALTNYFTTKIFTGVNLKVKSLKLYSTTEKYGQKVSVADNYIAGTSMDFFKITQPNVLLEGLNTYNLRSGILDNTFEMTLKDTTAKVFNDMKMPSEIDLNKFNSSTIRISAAIIISEIKNSYFLIHSKIIKIEACPIVSSTETSTYFQQTLSLTPNPSTTGLFYITGEAKNVQVYNGQGNVILPSIYNENILDLSAFPTGMYVVVATVNGAMVTKKVVRE